MAELMRELESTAEAKKISLGPQDKTLAEDYVKFYRRNIDLVSRTEEITLPYLEELGSLEAAARSFIEEIEANPNLQRQAGALAELDRVFNKQLAREYSRIGKELDRREAVLEERLESCEGIADSLERLESYDVVLGAADELIKMRKLSHSGKLERLVELRGAALAKQNYARATLRKERKSIRVEIKQSEEKSEPIYVDILKKTLAQLEKIGERRGEMGVLGEAQIRSLGEVRDSFYNSIDALGLKTPVEVVEQKIEEIGKRDIGQIGGFISRCERGRLGKRQLRQAIYYSEVLAVWEGYL